MTSKLIVEKKINEEKRWFQYKFQGAIDVFIHQLINQSINLSIISSIFLSLFLSIYLPISLSPYIYVLLCITNSKCRLIISFFSCIGAKLASLSQLGNSRNKDMEMDKERQSRCVSSEKDEANGEDSHPGIFGIGAGQSISTS